MIILYKDRRCVFTSSQGTKINPKYSRYGCSWSQNWHGGVKSPPSSQHRLAQAAVGLSNMEKIKYHDMFNQTPRYQYGNNIVGLTVGALTKYLNKILRYDFNRDK